MSELQDLRRRAETCLRLAETASSPRAHHLFREMAAELLARAAELEQISIVPQLAEPAAGPPAQSQSPAAERWIADLKAIRERF